ncbi:hypothetical protein quinque_007097 [Culex quinquefasciatus]
MEFSAELPQFTLPSTPDPFCAFCLREQPSNVEFYKHVVGSTTELRNSFQSMLGYDFQLANFSICKPCWKLMQLVQDFRLRCFKANCMAERIGQGLRCEDGWFTMKNLAIIESVRMMIKDQVQQIGIEEELRATDQEGELESTIEFSGFKIETVETLAKEDSAKYAMEPAFNEKHHYQYEAHMNKHEGKTPYNCRKNCTKGFTSQPARKAHEAKCAIDERQCNLCDEKLFTEERLAEHYDKVHPQEKKFPCKLCGTRFSKRQCLKTHMQIKHAEMGPETFPCPICGKRLSFQYNIKAHIESVHGRERNFQCEICKKRLTNRSCLQIHVARFHPEAATDYARELLNRKQARMREETKRKALERVKERTNLAKGSLENYVKDSTDNES